MILGSYALGATGEPAEHFSAAVNISKGVFKKVPSKPGTDKCGICSQVIKEDALYCEGECQTWIHRYCAGIPIKLFKTLAGCSTPFYCYSCNLRAQQLTIQGLHEDIATLRTELSIMKSSIERLTDVVHENDLPTLCQQVKALSEDQSTSTAATWSEVVRNKRPSKKSAASATSAREGSDGNTQKSAASATSAREDSDGNGNTHHKPKPARSPMRKRTTIVGARRIWGTLKNTTVTAVSATLKRLTSTDTTKLKIKRKFKTATSDPSRVQKWWFMVRGDEELIKQLEEKWDIVAMQTAWKLEPAFMYVEREYQVQNRDTVTQSDKLQPITSKESSGESANEDDKESSNGEPANVNAIVSHSTSCFISDDEDTMVTHNGHNDSNVNLSASPLFLDEQ